MAQAMTAQMNFRIDASLKERGDAAFAQMGYTPSEVVRAIWSLVASGGRGMDALKGVLAKGTIIVREEEHKAAEENKLPADDDDAVSQLMPWELFDYYVAQLGEGYEVVPTTLSDDELLEMEMFDRMREKGLL